MQHLIKNVQLILPRGQDIHGYNHLPDNTSQLVRIGANIYQQEELFLLPEKNIFWQFLNCYFPRTDLRLLVTGEFNSFKKENINFEINIPGEFWKRGNDITENNTELAKLPETGNKFVIKDLSNRMIHHFECNQIVIEPELSQPKVYLTYLESFNNLNLILNKYLSDTKLPPIDW